MGTSTNGSGNGFNSANKELYLPDGTSFLVGTTGSNGPKGKNQKPPRNSIIHNRHAHGSVESVEAFRSSAPGFAVEENKSRRRCGLISSAVFATSLDCLDDSSPVDLIAHPHDPTRTLFAVRTTAGVEFRPRVKYCGEQLLAPSREQTLLQYTMLPRGVQPYGTASELAKGIGQFLSDNAPVPHDVQLVCECFVLQSWGYKSLPVCPTVILHGPPGYGDALTDLLRLICRRALVVGYATPSNLLRACSHFRPTLLIQESGVRPDILRVLRAGTRANAVALQGGAASCPFGPRLVVCSTLPGDSYLAGHAIVVELPSDVWMDTSRLSDPEVLERAELLQQRLLQFSFDSFRRLRPVPGECPVGVLPKQWHLLRHFFSPFADDAARLAELEATARRSWGGSQPTVEQKAVVMALFSLIHTTQSFGVGDVAKQANEGLMEFGEGIDLTDRKVGDILRNQLGVAVANRRNWGYPVLVDHGAYANIHSLVKQLGLLQRCRLILQWRPVECRWCREMGFTSEDEQAKYFAEISRRVEAAEARHRPFGANIDRLRRKYEKEDAVGASGS